MLRTLAQWWARRAYIWNQEREAATESLHAALSARRAQEKRDAATQLRKDAEDMDARVKQMAEMEQRGFWLCEDGHEKPKCTLGLCDEHEGSMCQECKTVAAGDVPNCEQCGKPMRLIKRSDMTGQEQYESDKQRKEVETMIANKRQLAEQYDKDAQGGDETAKHFTKQAASSRDVAERLRKL